MPEWLAALIMSFGSIGIVLSVILLMMRYENRKHIKALRAQDLEFKGRQMQREAIACCPEEDREWLYAHYWGGPHAELCSFDRSPAMKAIVALGEGEIADLKPGKDIEVVVKSKEALAKALSSISERLQVHDNTVVPPKRTEDVRASYYDLDDVLDRREAG